jgi:trk system potassium uptake protein TrkH
MTLVNLLLTLLGWVLLVFCVFLLPPIFIALIHEEPAISIFSGCAFLSLFLGGAFVFAFPRPIPNQLSLSQSFLVTLFLWSVIAFLSSLPFYASLSCTFTAALFESSSCLTTTGLTLFPHPPHFPESLHYWRFFLQWMGGFGIVLVALTLIPALKVGGSHLIFTEFSDRFEKNTPHTATITAYLLGLYVTLTFLCTISLWFLGSPLKDSLYYGMSCVSTGGLELEHRPVSVLNVGSKLILILFSILGSCPFLVLMTCWKEKRLRSYFQNDQIKGYMKLLCFSTAIIWLWQFSHHHSADLLTPLFKSVAALSTSGMTLNMQDTGFLSLWLIFLSFIGGCSGSTAGGIKVFRLQILYRVSKREILRMIRPLYFFVTLHNKRPVSSETISSVMTVSFLYLIAWVIFSLFFSFIRLPAYDALMLSSSLITNTGYLLTPYIQTVQHFSTFELWLGIIAMLCGRLEFVTLLAVLVRPFSHTKAAS